MRQLTGSALIKVIACRLFGAKPLPEPMLTYSQLDSLEQILVKFESEFCHFHSRKCVWNCRLPIWRPFCQGRDELIAAIAGWLATCTGISSIANRKHAHDFGLLSFYFRYITICPEYIHIWHKKSWTVCISLERCGQWVTYDNSNIWK